MKIIILANHKAGGSTEMGMSLFILAILGAIALPNFWQSLPLWGKFVSVIIIGLLVVAGLIFLGQPSGMGTRAMEQEIKEAVKRDKEKQGKE